MSGRQVALDGGPFDGALVEATSKAMNMIGEPVPDGHVARYSATRDAEVYRFRGLSKVVLTLDSSMKVTMP